MDPEEYVQLDEVVAVTTALPKPPPDDERTDVDHYGVVDAIESAYEGASFHSDVFRDAEGTLPVTVSTIAHVSVTRVGMRPSLPETEVLVPPRPGRAVRRADEADRELALYFDKMKDARFPAGLSRDGLPVYGNLEFLDGSRGAHVNISGISGVATKTTYALFLLYGLFHSSSLQNAHSTHAIIFNVKGEDLLWLDKPNGKLPDDEHRKYASLGLPVGPFGSVGLWAPAQRGDVVLPDTGSRAEGVDAYYWTLREFCRERMLRFLFADADDETSQLGFVITQVERFLESQEALQIGGRRRPRPAHPGRRRRPACRFVRPPCRGDLRLRRWHRAARRTGHAAGVRAPPRSRRRRRVAADPRRTRRPRPQSIASTGGVTRSTSSTSTASTTAPSASSSASWSSASWRRRSTAAATRSSSSCWTS